MNYIDQHDEEFLRKAAEAKTRVLQIAPSNVDELFRSRETAIDVREADVYKNGNISGSNNISIDVLAQKVAEFVPDKPSPIICFCNGGNRGPLAAAQLKDIGYNNVSSIDGGLKAYSSSKEN